MVRQKRDVVTGRVTKQSLIEKGRFFVGREKS